MGRDVRIGVIGGTGIGERLLDGVGRGAVKSVEVETPFGAPSGPVVTGSRDGVAFALLSRHGDGHLLNPGRVPSRANIFALKSLGCTHVVAFGACGSLRDQIAPGDLVVCDQLIDRTLGRPRTFYERAAVHVELAEPFCPVMRRWLIGAAPTLENARVHDTGCYVCMEGPAFSTRAESHMHRLLGADVVGMTAQPEARLAREAEMAYALVALPTDYDCWRPREGDVDQESLLGEIMGNLETATESSFALLNAALGDVTTLRETASPAHDALRLAIWSEKEGIGPAEVDRLRPLWGRYFPAAVKASTGDEKD